MLGEFFERLAADKRSRGNPLVVHLSLFAASLMESGYADATIRSKLWLLADFGSWVGRSGQAVADLDERLAERFLAARRRGGRIHRCSRETVTSFWTICANAMLSVA